MRLASFCILLFIGFSCTTKNQENQRLDENKNVITQLDRKDASLNLLQNVSAMNNVVTQEEFKIEVVRGNTTGNLVTGVLFVKEKLLGTTYENNALKINAGTYPGYLRYISQKGFVQGPDGYMGDTGDFLLEIGKVKWSNGKERTSLLFHGGNKPEHSQGCIMLGPVSKNTDGNRVITPDHTLYKLRTEFYGTNNPISSPNKKIIISIK